MKIRFVVATRVSETEFFTNTATGRTLKMIQTSEMELCLFPNNRESLSTIYNQVIRQSLSEQIVLVFAHDDLHFMDYYTCSRIMEGLSKFGVLGIAGNRRRLPRQPSWNFIDASHTWDSPENLSGVVGHGNSFPPGNISVFGPPRQKVALLDGLLLACDSRTCLTNNLFFDERFAFHFYDVDFCRHAEMKGVSCGTWDLSVIHESSGGFYNDAWRNAYQQYLEKWGE